MKTSEQTITAFSFTPNLTVHDSIAAYWLMQVSVRLRREICWLWYEQGVSPREQPERVPFFNDRLSSALNGQRSWESKQRFFKDDPTARYLSEKLEQPAPGEYGKITPGSFAWLQKTLQLDNQELFVLALGLLTYFDGAAGSVIAACLNDPSKVRPTLSLAQRLWDSPEEILSVASPACALFQYGLLVFKEYEFHGQDTDWDRPVCVAPLVAEELLFPGKRALPGLLLTGEEYRADRPHPVLELIAGRLNENTGACARIVPLLGSCGAAYEEIVQAVSAGRKRPVLQFTHDPVILKNKAYLDALAAFCWLRNIDLFFTPEQVSILSGNKDSLGLEQLPKISIPVVYYLALAERKQIADIPENYLLPVLEVKPLAYRERLELWRGILGTRARGLDTSLAECAKRFRFQKHTIEKICDGLRGLEGPLSEPVILAACRAELNQDLSELAAKVIPRFDDEELILPRNQAGQFLEVLQAMRALTEVHYEWGTEKVWNESGISVLFAGPPGTGKTMAAEILAIRLGLPMWRIDLSQVASKYIGETEKNLKRLFDRADISDTILFFDEADALYGKRTEVKDAHDRYANLEISYLLERMERFKGLAILATNRKKDLDDAFLRRLRYIVDFPMPGEEERRRIWRQVIPGSVDCSLLDMDFLARRFALAGGHIRSIIFNACLQSAGGSGSGPKNHKGRLTMENVIIAVKREYDKLNRTVSLEQFEPYAHIIKKLEAQEGAYKDT